MTAPPFKPKRGGHFGTTPSNFGLADRSAIVCSAQQECEHSETRIEQLANGPHHAKEVCSDCGQVLRFVPKPATIERQHTNAFRLAKLAMSPVLTSWERGFVKSVSQHRKLSPRQQDCLDRIYAERMEGAT